MKLTEPLLDIENLKVHFNTEEGVVRALDGINLSVEEGLIHGLIGESGCGKTVTSLTILRLLEENALIKSGIINFKGENLLKLDDKRFNEEIRGREISMIFQDPESSLNPSYTAGNQVEESVKLHRSEDNVKKIALEELENVNLPEPEAVYESYPHELSGGMVQRVMIAMMLAPRPSLLIADEPTTALDVSIQAQFINLLLKLQKKTGISVLYITHDMSVISEICNRVSVMYAGQIIETGTTRELFDTPKHPYTKRLINCVPRGEQRVEDWTTIEGTVPNLINPPPGCRFHPRCEYTEKICKENYPETLEISDTHKVSCHLVEKT